MRGGPVDPRSLPDPSETQPLRLEDPARNQDGVATRLIGNEEPSREFEDLVGKVVDGRYTVKRLIGEGAMGAVYLASQHSVRREVALKVIRPNKAEDPVAIQRFLREAAVASRLANPHTITIHDFGRTSDGMLYLAMEYLRGRTLADLMEEEAAPMEPLRAVRIIVQVLESLAEAHDAGVLHRDLKPGNLFVIPAGGAREFIKILDFGVAKLLDPEVTALTATGVACGTPAYMSPEQAQAKPLDVRSDLYTVGVILFELLTGRLPFEGASPVVLVVKKVRERAPRVSDLAPGRRIPSALEAVVARLLEADPSLRPSSVREVQDLLASAMGGRERISGTRLPVVSVAEAVASARQPGLPRWALFAIGGAFLAAGVGIALWAVIGRV